MENDISDNQTFKMSLEDLKSQSQNNIIAEKEHKALKRAKYHLISEKFKTAYVLQNINSNLVVEIRAASSYHACKIIGWKSNQTRLLEVIDIEKREKSIKQPENA